MLELFQFTKKEDQDIIVRYLSFTPKQASQKTVSLYCLKLFEHALSSNAGFSHSKSTTI